MREHSRKYVLSFVSETPSSHLSEALRTWFRGITLRGIVLGSKFHACCTSSCFSPGEISDVLNGPPLEICHKMPITGPQDLQYASMRSTFDSTAEIHMDTPGNGMFWQRAEKSGSRGNAMGPPKCRQEESQSARALAQVRPRSATLRRPS